MYSAEAFGQAWFAGKREALEAPGLKGGCSGVMYSGNDAYVLQQCSFALTVQGVLHLLYAMLELSFTSVW